MKTITLAVELYTFEELSEKAQDKAINRLLDAWLEYGDLVWEETQPVFKDAIAEAHRMQTPWFAKEIVFHRCNKYVFEELNNWYFEADGKEYDYIELVDQEMKMCADENSLMDYCRSLTDFLDRVTDDLFQVLQDEDVSDEVGKHLERGTEELVEAWKLLRNGD